ncbi:MAG: sulfatase-like hydrolase/transferase [Rikenellaceae bacterium]
MNSNIKLYFASALVLAPMTLVAKSNKAERPNVIIILCDDLGSNDVGFRGCTDIATPHIDRIANEGVDCRDAYISAPYSGPSRCGLFTGRYQQRFGGEENIIDNAAAIEQGHGVPTDELMMTEMMKAQGYKTAVIGKWHMGNDAAHTPMSRGTDYYYGFHAGSYNYWGIPNPQVVSEGTIMENHRPVPASEVSYLTDDFTDKTVDFINKNADENFFVYLSYNAPHSPFQAIPEYLDRTTHIYDPWRSVYAAMILAVDDGVGKIWESLEANGIDDNTMIIFLSDNGGINLADNSPRRAWKGNMYEGGISTPFAIYWKGVLQGGKRYDHYISALDIFPTVAVAAGADISKFEKPLDGVDLIPHLRGKKKSQPHETLFWRTCGGFEWAVRTGDYKLVKSNFSDTPQLFNLKKDIGESTDISSEYPELVATMSADFNSWSSQMVEPAWHDPHKVNQVKDYNDWVKYRKRSLRPTK